MSQLWSGSHIRRANSVSTPGSHRTLEPGGVGSFKRAFAPWLCSGGRSMESVSTNNWLPCLTLFISFISCLDLPFPGVQKVENGSPFSAFLQHLLDKKSQLCSHCFIIHRLGTWEDWRSQSRHAGKLDFSFSRLQRNSSDCIFYVILLTNTRTRMHLCGN